MISLEVIEGPAHHRTVGPRDLTIMFTVSVLVVSFADGSNVVIEPGKYGDDAL